KLSPPLPTLPSFPTRRSSDLSSEPYSDKAIATVARIRENVGSLKSEVPLLGSSVMYVGGATASVTDLTNSTGSDFFNLTTLVLRSEEHTSELQSRFDLVCRLL